MADTKMTDAPTIPLEGDDLTFFNEAEKLKKQGITHFTAKKPNHEKALAFMGQALEELNKVQNRTQDVCVLQSHVCQNMALIHKQKQDFQSSLAMSAQALEANPDNWKAMVNTASLSSSLALANEKKWGESLPVHEAAVETCKKALAVPNADKKAIEQAMHPIFISISNSTSSQDTCIEVLTAAIAIKEEASSLFTRFRVYMAQEKWNEAISDGDKILELDPNYLNGKFKNKWYKFAKQNKRKVPVTILTGFLGSGKTTLLNRILSENHGKRIAVIENEFGAVGIDDKLVEFQQHTEDQVIEIMNGCICCTVRQDLVTTLLEMKKKYFDTNKIDYIIIETTGMADPAPVLQTFLINEEIQDFCAIDSCITICDSSQIVQRLEEDREKDCENEAVEQVCFADKIFLNKIDLCNREQLDAATQKIRTFNTQASIDEVQFNDKNIPFAKILDQDSFSIDRVLEIDSELLNDVDQEHKHDSRIGTFSYKMEAEMTMESANEFLGNVLREKGANIYRMKGFINIKDHPQKFVFHSVGMLTSCTPYSYWEEGEKRECVFVIIGKHLEQKWLEDQFKAGAIVPPKDVQMIKNVALEESMAKQKAAEEANKKEEEEKMSEGV